MRKNRESVFWSYVIKTDSCWFWAGSTKSHGYGCFWDGKRHVRAHRYSYELLNGQIPVGLCLDHLCRNKACVNPSHLEAVTMRENVIRGIGPTAINAKKEQCDRGHAFTKENTHINKLGSRVCRECQRMLNFKWAKENPERLRVIAYRSRLKCKNSPWMKHGATRYRDGCRCEECRIGHRLKAARDRESKRAKLALKPNQDGK